MNTPHRPGTAWALVPLICLLTACGGSGSDDSDDDATDDGSGAATVPGAPTITSATVGDSSATLNFSAPASDGGSAITSYTANCGSASASGSASPLTVTGLSNGNTYSCTVSASNAVGTGSASAAVSVTLPAATTVPGAPTITAATPGDGSATLAFSAPSNNGGSAITGYAASCVATGSSGSANGTASPLTVTSLVNGSSYSCTVSASNAIGVGPASAAVSVTPAAAVASSRGWILGNGERSKHIFEDGSSQGVLVNVEAVATVSSGGKDYEQVLATGIPNYRVTVTEDILATLTSRPKASTDFVSGAPTVAVGDVVEFGQNIGYRSSNRNCNATGGYGYWPPGPECPKDNNKQGYFPLAPVATTSVCETGLGPVGYMVNGSSIYNWNDGQSYNNGGIWHNTAANAEVHDLDICSGHAARNDYHHHNWSSCQAEQIGDKGDGHSPVYGYAADGYPVHGPWYAAGTLAVSSWRKRDYDDAASASGCGGGGVRSCLLVDEYDLSKGTSTASQSGPKTTDTFTSQSGNPIPAVSGLFYEDHYHDPALTAQGGRYLDAQNGHDHDDLGYHYHLTVEYDAQNDLVPAFPFTFGPRFHGQLESNTIARCN